MAQFFKAAFKPVYYIASVAVFRNFPVEIHIVCGNFDNTYTSESGFNLLCNIGGLCAYIDVPCIFPFFGGEGYFTCNHTHFVCP